MRATKSAGTAAVAAAGVISVLLVACGGPEPTGDVGNAPTEGDAIEITADDSSFDPELIEAPQGQEVTFEITNEGNMPHEFSIEKLGISTGAIQPGETKTATFEVPEGRIKFVCRYHSGMTGAIKAQSKGGSDE